MEPDTSREQFELSDAILQRRERAMRDMMNAERAANRMSSTMRFEPYQPITNNDIKKTMKERHLSQEERQMNHRPGNDWCENKRGEKCYNAVSLEVADIVSKYG